MADRGDRTERVLEQVVPYLIAAVLAGVSTLIIWLLLPRADEPVALMDPFVTVLVLSGPLAAWTGFHLVARRSATFSFSRVGDLARTRRGLISWLAGAPRALRVGALVLLVFALARPQTFARKVTHVDGIDIVIVLDISKSMEERDLDPRRNRLAVAQQTIRNFLRGRKNDRIGLVVFAKQTMVQCPLTLDYGALDTIVSDVAIGDIESMGTAVGDGLGLALASLRRSDAKSKVVILLTDGDSNVVNVMSPDEARETARQQGVRVFTVLVGRELGATIRPDPFGRQPHGTNPRLLQQIASETKGRYFNAPNAAALDAGFEQVRATLEKTKRREVRRLPRELYAWFVVPALGFVLVELLLSFTRWRRFP
jgi:Ca-activated chloride channel family protein